MKYKRFLCNFIIVCFHKVTNGTNVTINTDIAGIVGRNGTFIECTLNRNGVHSLTSVNLQAKFSNVFENIVGLLTDGRGSALTDAGDYLKGRVSFGNITPFSDSANLYFNKLLCVDDRDYRCSFSFSPATIGGTDKSISESTHIQVQALPQTPEYVSYFPQTQTNNSTIVEDNNVTIDCRGNVGKPPGTLILHVMRTNGEILNFTADEIVTSEIPESCSFYQNSSFTVKVTATDDKAIFRCALKSLIYDDWMYKETVPINVKYQVRIPDIVVHRNKLMNTVTLSCSSTGNPTPEYAWYIYTTSQSTTVLSKWEFYANTQNLKLKTIVDRRIFRCEAYNIIGGKIYLKSTNISYTFTGDPDITKCQCTQNNNHVPAIIGSVFSTLGLCLATWGIIYLFRRSRLKNKSDSDQIRQMTPMDHQGDTPNYEGVSRDRTEHHYDDLRQRQDHHTVYTHLQAKRC